MLISCTNIYSDSHYCSALSSYCRLLLTTTTYCGDTNLLHSSWMKLLGGFSSKDSNKEYKSFWVVFKSSYFCLKPIFGKLGVLLTLGCFVLNFILIFFIQPWVSGQIQQLKNSHVNSPSKRKYCDQIGTKHHFENFIKQLV